MKQSRHQADFCVVGGGLAGLCAAVAAARHGAKVVLMQDRPVLGGNASSECRMHICGLRWTNDCETGILEELDMENRYRNPLCNYSIWDSILYEKAANEKNLTLLLNCTGNAASMNDQRIRSIQGWQLTTETWHTVEAALFADCSGDSILAPLTGAEFRIGREARSEFGERLAQPAADHKTMGMSCLIQTREMAEPQPFIPPRWANVYTSESDLPGRLCEDPRKSNYWWIELGGEDDSIHDTERLRDELLKIAFGVWDFVKNRSRHNAANLALEWVGFLPAKRESRRYIGDYMLRQQDLETPGRFDDMVAYGGWCIDDHPPAGILHRGPAAPNNPHLPPYGIPYRCLYSRNIDNLFFAGRNISATHVALSATRVMATCALLGQAVGTAAAIAAQEGLLPRAVGRQRLGELQQRLLDDDCYLLWIPRRISDLSRQAVLSSSSGDPEPLRNGVDRPVGANDNGWRSALGDWVEYRFDAPRQLRQTRLVFDSHLNRGETNMLAHYPLHPKPRVVPKSMLRAFRIEARMAGDAWTTVCRVENNYHRLVRLPLDLTTTAFRFIPESTWGAPGAHVFAWDVR